MKQGVLVQPNGLDCLDIRFDLDEYYGGLHCGQYLDVFHSWPLDSE